jgi:hypothetical protein
MSVVLLVKGSMLEGFGRTLAADAEFMSKARAEIADLERVYAEAIVAP